LLLAQDAILCHAAVVGPAGKSPLKGRVAAEMIFGNRKIRMIATEQAYRQLSDRSKPAVIPVLEPV